MTSIVQLPLADYHDLNTQMHELTRLVENYKDQIPLLTVHTSESRYNDYKVEYHYSPSSAKTALNTELSELGDQIVVKSEELDEVQEALKFAIEQQATAEHKTQVANDERIISNQKVTRVNWSVSVYAGMLTLFTFIVYIQPYL